MTRASKGEKKPSIVALAAELGVSRQTIYNWQAEAGNNAPAIDDIPGWRKFIADNDKLSEVTNRVGKSREQLLTEKIAKELVLLDLKIAEANRQKVDRSAVEAMFLHTATMQKTALVAALTRELPAKCEGKSANEIGILLKDAALQVCRLMQDNIERWTA